MNSTIGILAIIFCFILVVVGMDQSYSLKKAKIKAEKKAAEEKESSISKSEIIEELDQLEKRINNLEVIMREKDVN